VIGNKPILVVNSYNFLRFAKSRRETTGLDSEGWALI